MNKTRLILFLAILIIVIFGRGNTIERTNSRLTDHYWVLNSFIDTVTNDTSFYPDYGKDLWIEFTEDSLFFHGYCPTIGSWYTLANDANIEIGPLIIQLECNEPDIYLAHWNFQVTCLSSAYYYEFKDNQLLISTELAKMVFDETDEITGISSSNCNSCIKPKLADIKSSFSNEHIINYYLPQSIKQAHITIYDMEGKELYKKVINQKGNSSISISSTLLNNGLYICCLYVDALKVDCKKMLISKK